MTNSLILQTVACQIPLPMGFFKQEYWSGLPSSSPENLPDPGIEPVPHLLNWQVDPGGSDDKESACNVGDLGSIPGLGRSPEEGNGYPLQYSCLKNPMYHKPAAAAAKSLQSCPILCDPSNTTEYPHTHNWFTLLYTWNLYNIVNQLHSRKLFKKHLLIIDISSHPNTHTWTA